MPFERALVPWIKLHRSSCKTRSMSQVKGQTMLLTRSELPIDDRYNQPLGFRWRIVQCPILTGCTPVHMCRCPTPVAVRLTSYTPCTLVDLNIPCPMSEYCNQEHLGTNVHAEFRLTLKRSHLLLTLQQFIPWTS